MEFVTVILKNGESFTTPADLMGQAISKRGISQLEIASIVRN